MPVTRRTMLHSAGLAAAGIPLLGLPKTASAKPSTPAKSYSPLLDNWVSVGLTTIAPRVHGGTHSSRDLHAAAKLMQMHARHLDDLGVDKTLRAMAISPIDLTSANAAGMNSMAPIKQRLILQSPNIDVSTLPEVFTFSPGRINRAQAHLQTHGITATMHQAVGLTRIMASMRESFEQTSHATPAQFHHGTHPGKAKLQGAVWEGHAPHYLEVSSAYCKMAKALLKKLGIKTDIKNLSPQDKEALCDLFSTIADTAALAAVWVAVGGCDVAGVAAAPVTAGVSLAAAAVACQAMGVLAGATVAVTLGVLNCAFSC